MNTSEKIAWSLVAANAMFSGTNAYDGVTHDYVQLDVTQYVAKGLAKDQLKSAFNRAAPDIIQAEHKRMNDLCAQNAEILQKNGIDCQKIMASYKATYKPS